MLFVYIFLLFKHRVVFFYKCLNFNPSGNIILICYIHFVLHFVIKMEILLIIKGFLYLQTKFEATEKALGHLFLKEVKATCKNAGESELNNKK